jgi:glycosyltransferase involved in cell wall biosynthesis
MPQVWQAGDISILVSEFEGTSISMLEAMAHGCVPVVTSVSGTSTVIQQGVTGYKVAVGDLVGMARVIELLSVDRDQLVELGSNAHRSVANRFSSKAYFKWFLKVLAEAGRLPPRIWPSGKEILPLTKFHSFLPQQFWRRLPSLTKFAEQVLRRMLLFV